MSAARPRALVVDDEQDIRELLAVALSRMEIDAITVENLAEAREQLAEREIAFCLTDMRLPDGQGIDLIRHMQKACPQVPVAVITAYGNTQAAVDSLKAGAFDFVSKPLHLEQLARLVEAALKLRGRGDSSDSAPEEDLLGDSPTMQSLRAMVARVARSQAPLHISGESGTGKERAARLVHALGARADGPFVPVNCGAIPAELMESELFGHVRGAFTGAARDKPGLFQVAEGGTLFLDEVAELPLHMQVKLLRALQERQIRPVGGETEIAINVRIISATNEALASRVASGQFRQDLYYRLNVIGLHMPPLREHSEDIPLLANHLLQVIARRNALGEPPQLDSASLETLMQHPFPGNVRELENVLERAITLCDGHCITPADIQLEHHPLLRARPSRAADADEASPPPAPSPTEAVEAHPEEGADLESRTRELERRAIEEALKATRWNRTRAAKMLGLSFRQLRYRIKKLGIDE